VNNRLAFFVYSWFPFSGLFKRLDVSRPPQHFVDFPDVLHLKVDVFPGIFLEHDMLVLDHGQQVLVILQRCLFVAKRFAENIADIVLVCLKQWADGE